jgi:hypothetical protein
MSALCYVLDPVKQREACMQLEGLNQLIGSFEPIHASGQCVMWDFWCEFSLELILQVKQHDHYGSKWSVQEIINEINSDPDLSGSWT